MAQDVGEDGSNPTLEPRLEPAGAAICRGDGVLERVVEVPLELRGNRLRRPVQANRRALHDVVAARVDLQENIDGTAFCPRAGVLQ